MDHFPVDQRNIRLPWPRPGISLGGAGWLQTWYRAKDSSKVPHRIRRADMVWLFLVVSCGSGRRFMAVRLGLNMLGCNVGWSVRFAWVRTVSAGAEEYLRIAWSRVWDGYGFSCRCQVGCWFGVDFLFLQKPGTRPESFLKEFA